MYSDASRSDLDKAARGWRTLAVVRGAALAECTAEVARLRAAVTAVADELEREANSSVEGRQITLLETIVHELRSVAAGPAPTEET